MKIKFYLFKNYFFIILILLKNIVYGIENKLIKRKMIKKIEDLFFF